MSSGKVWRVRWEGERAAMARERLDFADRYSDGVFRCGQAGALWTTMGVVAMDGAALTATLEPIAPHSVNPSATIVEVVLPSEAATG
jgi:hypothetical protein